MVRGTTTSTAAAWNFSASNQIRFGYSSDTLTASYAFGVAAGTNGDFAYGISFIDSNRVSWGGETTNIGGDIKYFNVKGVADNSMSVYAVSQTVLSSSGNVDVRSLSFLGSGIASIGVSNGSVIVNVPPPTANAPLFSAGTTSGLSLTDRLFKFKRYFIWIRRLDDYRSA
jgi:hypothetical protein